MKVAVIQCPNWGVNGPPLGIAYIAANTAANNHEVTVFDLNVELFDKSPPEKKEFWKTGMIKFDEIWTIEKNLREQVLSKDIIEDWAKSILTSEPAVVGFSVAFSNEAASKILAKKLKEMKQELIIVFGGPHYFHDLYVDMAVKEEFIDYFVIGEGEVSFPQLLGFIESKQDPIECEGLAYRRQDAIVKTQPRAPNQDLDNIRFPNFSSFPSSKYLFPKSLPIMMSRGCTNRCAFCSEHNLFKRYRRRTAKNVVDEIKQQVNDGKADYFMFNDSLINGDIQRLEELCDLLIQENLGIHWNAQLRIRPEMTKELLTKMNKAGCDMLVYGIESASPKILKRMEKNFDLKTAQRVLKDTHDAGIMTVTNWLFGFPGESWIDYLKSMAFVFKNRKIIKIGPPWGNPCVILENSTLGRNKEKYGIVGSGPEWHSPFYFNNRKTREFRTELFRKMTRHHGMDAFR